MPNVGLCHLVFASMLLHCHEIVHVIYIIHQLVKLVSATADGPSLFARDSITICTTLDFFEFVGALCNHEGIQNYVLN